MRTLLTLGFVAIASVALAEEPLEQSIAQDDMLQGSEFQTDETRALQADTFANPGLLWVDRGAVLFSRPAGRAAVACADCHETGGTGLHGAATRYPAVDEETGALLNLEGRINTCRTRHQEAEPLPYESDALLSLTAYVAGLSRGMNLAPDFQGAAAAYLKRGRELYTTRIGQMNLACTHCHDDNYGQMLRGDRISQGHPTGYPAYRLTWQTMGSLHRRLTACYLGVRAEPRPGGDPDYLTLELYLAWRAQGLEIEAPGVRR